MAAEILPDNRVSTPHTKTHVNGEHENDRTSFSSDAPQTGVKNIELVSQTWTQSSLVVAYLG